MPSADSLRMAWEDRARSSAIEPVMTITEAGLVLGAGSVLAKRRIDRWGRPSLALDGNEERLLALLSVAYGEAVKPSVIDNIRAAKRAYERGEGHLAPIHLAYTGLPRLAQERLSAYRLFLADALLDEGMPPRNLLEACGLDGAAETRKAGFNPDEPRVPAGNPDGGQWTTDGGDPAIVPAAARRPASRGGNPDAFFDAAYDKIHALAQRLNVNENSLLGLAAHESWYLNAHNRALNNLFGVTRAGGSNLHFASIDAAIADWEQRYGPIVRSATTAQDFVERLYEAGYNTKDRDWRGKVLTLILRDVPIHLEAWKAKRNI